MSICLGGPTVEVKLPPQVVNFGKAGAPLLKSAEPVGLCNPQADPLHGDIGTDPLWSGLGPGDALPGHLKSCTSTEVTSFWCVCGREQFGLCLLSPRSPCKRRGAEKILPFVTSIRLH